MRLRLWVAAAVGLVLVAAGCGGSSALDTAQMTAFVDAQARALCAVQSHAYPSQAEQEAAYKKALQSSKLPADTLAKAQEQAKKDEAVRKQVSDRVAALCGS